MASFSEILKQLGRGAVRRQHPELETNLQLQRLRETAEQREAEKFRTGREREAFTLEELKTQAGREKIQAAAQDRLNRLREQKLSSEVLSYDPELVKEKTRADIEESRGRAAYYSRGGGRAPQGEIGPTVTVYDDQGQPQILDKRTGQAIGSGRPPAEPTVQAVPSQLIAVVEEEVQEQLKSETARAGILGFGARAGLEEGSPEYWARYRTLMTEALINRGWSSRSVEKAGRGAGTPDDPIVLE